MRTLNLFMIFVVLFVFTACGQFGSTPKEHRSVGIRQSVLPVFVVGYNTSERWGLAGKGFRKSATADFKACSAVYVAPHLLATSSSVFPKENSGVTMYDPGSVAILDGSIWAYSADVPFFDPQSGLVLIRTYVEGAPLPLRDGPLYPTDKLRRVGYTFQLSYSGFLATPLWDEGQASVSYALDSLSSVAMFGVRTQLHIGNCGAAIVGDDGRLAGIMHKRIGDEEASVIGPAAIRAAVESVK